MPLVAYQRCYSNISLLIIKILENFHLIKIFILFGFIFRLQVTQLKIVSNPFAKGFRENDTNDE